MKELTLKGVPAVDPVIWTSIPFAFVLFAESPPVEFTLELETTRLNEAGTTTTKLFAVVENTFVPSVKFTTSDHVPVCSGKN